MTGAGTYSCFCLALLCWRVVRSAGCLGCGDIEETQTGLLVTIRQSKTDQEGAGDVIALARGDVACPVKALRAWLQAAGIEGGAIFRPIGKASKLRSGLRIGRLPMSSTPMLPALAWTQPCFPGIRCDRGF